MSSDLPRDPGDPRDAFFDVSQLGQLGRQAGRSATTVLVFSVLKLAITLVTTAVLARLVPPEEQGLVALVMPVILLATGLSEFGLAQAVIQRDTITHRVVSALFWVNVALGLAMMTAAALLAPAAATFYDEPKVVPILLALSPYVLFSVTAVHYVAILRRRMQIRTAEICSFAGMAVAAILSIGAALMGAGPWALVVQLNVAQGSSLLFLMAVVRWVPSLPWRSALGEAREALVFGGYLSGDRVLNELVSNLRTLLIGRAFGEVGAGLFYRSQTFALMPARRILGPLGGAFIPSLSRLQNDPDGFRTMLVRQVTRSNLIMMPVGLLMVLAADTIVAVLLGPDWAAAAPILAWLGVQTTLSLTGTCGTWALVACGRAREVFRIRVATSIALIVVMLATINIGLVTFVAAFVLCQVIFVYPVVLAVAMRFTLLDLASLRRALLPDLLFAGAVIASGFALRAAMTADVLVEGVLIGLFVACAQGLRILLTPMYRSDILKVIGRR